MPYSRGFTTSTSQWRVQVVGMWYTTLHQHTHPISAEARCSQVSRATQQQKTPKLHQQRPFPAV